MFTFCFNPYNYVLHVRCYCMMGCWVAPYMLVIWEKRMSCTVWSHFIVGPLGYDYYTCPKVNLLCPYHVQFELPHNNSILSWCEKLNTSLFNQGIVWFLLLYFMFNKLKNFVFSLFLSCNISYNCLISIFSSFCPLYALEVFVIRQQLPIIFWLYGQLWYLQRTRDLDTVALLDHLPPLQQLLFRLLACQVDSFY